MFSAADLKARLRRRPCIPIRIKTSGGETFDILRLDFAIALRRYVEIGESVPEDPDLPDRMHLVSILHITSVVDLAQPTPQPAAPTGTAGPS